MLQEEKEARQISGVGFVLAVYAISRIFYLISGFLLAKFVPTSSHQLTTTDVPPGTLNIWSYWDGEHYVALALNGYFQAPRYISPAFFRCTHYLLDPSQRSLAVRSPRKLSHTGVVPYLCFPSVRLLLHI